MEQLEGIIFYTIDKAIKTYRQFAQKRLNKAGLDITIDQWLVMQAVLEEPEASQQRISERVFKDAASVTRIVALLIKKKFLERLQHGTDKRRFHLRITKQGKMLLQQVAAVVATNRSIALHEISENDLNKVRTTLNRVIDNCKNED